MLDYEAQRQANLLQKQKLLEQLHLSSSTHKPSSRVSRRVRSLSAEHEIEPTAKKRKVGVAGHNLPTRTSARVAAKVAKPHYKDDDVGGDDKRIVKSREIRSRSKPRQQMSLTLHARQTISPPPTLLRSRSLSELFLDWNNWIPSASEPTLTPAGTYYFASHPHFTPNKAPITILLEGAFGGSYFSEWHSRVLNVTLKDDYLHTLPKSWLRQLQPPEKYLVSPTYSASLNKFQVQCGQTLSEWEAAGWMNFDFDPRGWFEWYLRFWLGRRCNDDDRQVGRWNRCVGEKGRWKRTLLKKYVDKGVRSVYSDDDDGEAGQEKEVSPVIHQTCHHWAYEVRQADLDRAWAER